MIRVLLLLLAFGLVASCAPISQEACQAGNWQGIGLADGAAGKPAGTAARYAETCAEFGVVPDLKAYEAGRAQGLQTYCTPDNAYDEGRKGRAISPVCTPQASLLMKPAHRHGLKYHEIGEDIDQIEDRIRDRERLLAANYSGTLTPAQDIEAAAIRAEIRGLESDRFRLSIRQRRYASWP